MTRLAAMATVGLTATGLLISVILAAAAPAPEPAVKGADKWEYCEIQARETAAEKGGVAGAGQPLVPWTVRWITAGDMVETLGWEDMATMMKAPPPAKKDAPPLTHKMRVMNYLGSEGWEMVSYHKPAGAGAAAVSVWIFKRKVAK